MQFLLISHLMSDTGAQSYHKQRTTAWRIQTTFFTRQWGYSDGHRTKSNWLFILVCISCSSSKIFYFVL